ncbi:MAG: hypothetical protein ACR2N4_17990 [Jatrophihabitans sp.]
MPYRYGLPRLEDAPGIAAVILRAHHVAALAAAAGRVPVVYQICAPVEDVAARLAARGTPEPERALRLAATAPNAMPVPA